MKKGNTVVQVLSFTVKGCFWVPMVKVTALVTHMCIVFITY